VRVAPSAAKRVVPVSAKRRKEDVADHKREILAFQRLLWERLPLRKYVCRHSMVFDIAAVVIQEWPCESIDISKSGDTVEVRSLEELVASCKRHLALACGHPGWEMWAETLKYLTWQTIWITLRWYRSDPKNAAAMKRWRGKWRHRRN